MKEYNLIPVPESFTLSGASYRLDKDGIICLDNAALYGCVRIACVKYLSGMKVTVRDKHISPQIDIAYHDGLGDEGYTLSITEGGVIISYSAPAGVFYAFMTLNQLLDVCDVLPVCEITDKPAYAVRGYMLDIGRNKVPKLCEIKKLIDMLSGLKINHVELYIEGIPFEYGSFPDMWQGRDVMTGQDVLELDAYCKERFIELVPTQNNFGHMDKWLIRQYRRLAECPDGFTFDGSFLPNPRCLNPLDAGSESLVNSLADDFLPYFSSPHYNICCDETLELGQGKAKEECEKIGKGRVYLNFLKKVCAASERHGKSVLFWDDIIRDYPELLAELPGDAVALEWGYLASQPAEENCEKLKSYGVNYYVCPGTGAWNTLLGKTGQMISNIDNAALRGLKHGAVGLLNTDWGDCGHLQSIVTSYAGITYGAAMSWSPVKKDTLNLASALDSHVFMDKNSVMGRLALEAGDYYKHEGRMPNNITLSFLALISGLNASSVADGLTYDDMDRVEKYLLDLCPLLTSSDMKRNDAQQILLDYELALREVILLQTLLRYHVAVRLGDGIRQKLCLDTLAGSLPSIIEQTEKYWLVRNRYSYLDESVSVWKNLYADVMAKRE